LCGHGAILSFYPELKGRGIKKECTDFSTQENFPKSIVKALKKGQLCKIGDYAKWTLNKEGLNRYNKIRDQALTEYNKIRDPAWAEYNKINDQAWAEYEKIKNQAFIKIISQKKFRNKNWK